ncbi:MAG: hypothetical protein PHQ28_15250 [Mycobacterium sp.]|nr:hypothetical protein [Mycobacterium sp.]
MTGPHSETESPGARPISVAELLARNGTIGAPAVTRRRRRRRGDSDAVTVAELTGDLPVIRDDDVTEPEPRWPEAPPPQRVTGPERSAYPRPLRQTDAAEIDRTDATGQQSGAEEMSPDPLDDYADTPVDVMEADLEADPEAKVHEPDPGAELGDEDSAYVRSYLQSPDSPLFGGGQTLADEIARQRGEERSAAGAESSPADAEAAAANRAARWPEGRAEGLWHAGLTVLQSILAVAFGAGLFIAFDQLWRWNSIVALVLSVLVILGLVVGVRVVRKTEDIASTLIAVAVGALITLGPLALSLRSS